METVRHVLVEKDLKALKRFPSPQESLEAWERLFCLKGLNETPAIEQYPGFGQRKIYKARVVPLKENVSKAKGYRLIFEMISETQVKILVFSRHGIYNSEQELINIIKERLE
jgi:hypothetical protein